MAHYFVNFSPFSIQQIFSAFLKLHFSFYVLPFTYSNRSERKKNYEQFAQDLDRVMFFIRRITKPIQCDNID